MNGEVRVTVRLQWDTTIVAHEVFMPAIALTHPPGELVAAFAAPAFTASVEQLRERSITRLCDQMEVT